MSDWSFRNLDLSGVDMASGATVLKPGRWVCKATEVELDMNSGKTGRILKVKLVEVNGQGVITAKLNVQHQNADAQRIGLGELKALLTHGGHPNPEKPGDIKSVKGLVTGVTVTHDSSTYVDNKGKTRERGSQVSGYFDPAEAGYVRGAGSAGGGSGDGADIPF
ncbi:hypothetical protein TSH7_09865 [Azospirillum sp. TSH7]|uniref:hypothetical protein n=1 Tax=unclassified Azospirillum TaxID=2630922 RepID=UPI000D615695|nr:MULTISPECIES: hypothetical protein [unclassified Azospirillum]PWC63976.1 hypothetical protein TSH20_18960 [Azospirillum sp. TSH20]PWC64839.1 hypothetical protein TSH7_09865 [Azospirillum sp. TSH7]